MYSKRDDGEIKKAGEAIDEGPFSSVGEYISSLQDEEVIVIMGVNEKRK